MVIPLVPKRAHRSKLESFDIRPRNVEHGQGSCVVGEDNICHVCGTKQHRYCCPQCKCMYCSVECYRSHANSCTEVFYQRNVSRVLNVESKESGCGEDIQKILQRLRASGPEDDMDGAVNQDAKSLSRPELIHILDQLESIERNNEGVGSFEKFFDNQPERIRSVLSEAITSGDTRKSGLEEWLLEPWSPWWRPLFTDSSLEECGESEEENDTTATPTLDEQILAIPPFRSLCKRTTFVPLQFNLIDILYASVWIQRLYHGVDNALVAGSSHEVNESLLLASSVLGKTDRRYTNLSEVLVQCTRRSAAETSALSCHVAWNVLVEDVRLLCTNHRYVARCLLETEALLRKQKQKKKLQYYMSWALEHRDIVADMAPEIAEWIREWTLIEGDTRPQLNVHDVSRGAKKATARSSTPPFIVERESRVK